jgi:hypothetical protein
MGNFLHDFGWLIFIPAWFILLSLITAAVVFTVELVLSMLDQK